MKEVIAGAEVRFAIDEARFWYKELLSLEPTAENYFDYANYLQDFYYFDEAIDNYNKALEKYRKLAEENPRTYLPDVAGTLYNLAFLHSDTNEFPAALEKYEEALEIYRKLAEEYPRYYEIDYAQMLIMGVDLFDKDSSGLEQAKAILMNYPDVYRAQQLLGLIESLEE